jgi:ferrous iron transport protein B
MADTKGLGVSSFPPSSLESSQEPSRGPSGATSSATISQRVVLAGNPNVGKSVVFNALTGKYANVSNFPGTTVDILKGQLPDGRILEDTPGVYGISDFSEEELVAAESILSADVVINVVSAVSLERDLFLTQQIIDYQRPLVVVLNQMDEAERQGLRIDVPALEVMLGVPVFPTVATTGQGLASVVPGIVRAETGHQTPDCPEPEVLKALEREPAKRLTLYGLRRKHVNTIVATVVHTTHVAPVTVSERIGHGLLNPLYGLLALLAALAVLYQVVGVWVAGDLVNFLENDILLTHVIPPIQAVVALLFPKDGPVFQILAGEFGVLTMTTQYMLGVMFPLVLGFYLYVSLLEDCGCLPRIAVLSDAFLRRIGLNGRAVIPIILGFGCVTMASVSTRVLTSQRERTIASTILAITIPCSAQIGVLMGLMAAAGGLKAWGLYLVGLILIMGLLGSALNRVLPGKSTSLVMDLPPVRVPLVRNVFRKTWIRTVGFLKEAAPLFLAGSVLVSVAQVTGTLTWLEGVLAPLTVNLLKLPQEAGQMFIMGMVRRDFGAAGLYLMAKSLSPAQILTALMTITLFVPCFASATVIFKERGWLESTAILLGSWAIAFATGAIMARVAGFIL